MALAYISRGVVTNWTHTSDSEVSYQWNLQLRIQGKNFVMRLYKAYHNKNPHEDEQYNKAHYFSVFWWAHMCTIIATGTDSMTVFNFQLCLLYFVRWPVSAHFSLKKKGGHETDNFLNFVARLKLWCFSWLFLDFHLNLIHSLYDNFWSINNSSVLWWVWYVIKPLHTIRVLFIVVIIFLLLLFVIIIIIIIIIIVIILVYSNQNLPLNSHVQPSIKSSWTVRS